MIIKGKLLIVPVASSPPASPVTGQIYFDDVLNRYRGYNTTPAWAPFSAAFGQVEVDFGSTPVGSLVASFTDGGVNTSSIVVASQAGNAATGRSADENEMDPLHVSAESGSGAVIFRITALAGPVVGKYKINYTVN